MMPTQRLTHVFVEYIPETLADGMIYISIPFATALHRCACGCGNEVVTPLSPTGWTLSFDGESISLDPSIGNWNFSCRSHYWIRRNTVRWAPQWSLEKLRVERSRDVSTQANSFDNAPATTLTGAPTDGMAHRLRRAIQRWASRLRSRSLL